MERPRLNREGLFPEGRRNKDNIYANQILNNLGLTARDLEGKITLDVGAGYRHIETAMKYSRLPGHIISIDLHSYSGSGYVPPITEPSNLLITDVREFGLPIQNDSVDLVICHGGPITGGALDERGVFPVSESLRVVKVGGEIRLAPIFQHASRVVQYQKFKAGEEGFGRNEAFDRLLRIYRNPRAYEIEFDEDGIPIPNSRDGELFWMKMEDKYPIQVRNEIYTSAAKELARKLHELGYNFELNLYGGSMFKQVQIKKIA